MFLLLLIAPIMYSLQSAAFKQKSIKVGAESATQCLFSTLYLAISTLVSALAAVISQNYNLDSALYGLVLGAVFYCFITCYDLAIQRGPLSMTCFVSALSMIVPVVLSIFLFGETLSVLNVIALVLVVISAYLINFSNVHEEKIKAQKGWPLLCALAFVFNAAVIFMTKLHAMNVTNGNPLLFVSTGNLVSLILSLFPLGFVAYKKGFGELKINKWFFIAAAGVGVSSVCGNGMLSITAGLFDSAVVYPTTNGLSLAITIILSRALFKEQIKGKALIGIIIGIVAVVLLSL